MRCLAFLLHCFPLHHEAILWGLDEQAAATGRAPNVLGRERTRKFKEVTPLHLACEHGSIEIVKMLLARFRNFYGGDKRRLSEYLRVPNGQDAEKSALHHAADYCARNGSTNLIKILLMYDANKLAVNKTG